MLEEMKHEGLRLRKIEQFFSFLFFCGVSAAANNFCSRGSRVLESQQQSRGQHLFSVTVTSERGRTAAGN